MGLQRRGALRGVVGAATVGGAGGDVSGDDSSNLVGKSLRPIAPQK